MAHKKAGGTTAGNRDSHGKRLGVKIYGGAKAKPGAVIIRQKGTKFFPGEGVKLGRDFTIFATREGTVKFAKHFGKKIITVA